MKRKENIIRREIDAELAFLDSRPSLHHDIMCEIKGERIVKKKISVALVFALMLLLSAVALAYTLSREYFEDVAQLQFASGYYDDWGWEEKQKMVEILEKHGLISAGEAAAMKAEADVDAYMIDRYGIDGRSDVIGLWGILEKELGDISTWTLEQKAWYTDMQIEIGLLTKDNDDFICALPGENDVQPEAAVEIAKAAVIEAYELMPDALDGHQVDIAFETHASDWERENLHYNINFWGEGLKYYSCSVTQDGKIMDSTMEEGVLSPKEQVQQDIRFANENDMEAIALFQQYANEHFPEGVYNFEYWPLEDKAAVTDMLRPVILENMAENPGYADYTRIFWATHFYGLPDEKAISQDKAIGLAKEQLTNAFGLSEEQAATVDSVSLFYEITDPEHPQWKVTLRVGEQRDAAAALDMKLFYRYRIVMDAYTGSVTETHLITDLANTPENVALQN